MPEADTVYRPADYPHGCQCSSCHRRFADGDSFRRIVVAWMPGVVWVSPVCGACVGAGVTGLWDGRTG